MVFCGVLLRPIPRDGRQLLGLPLEPVVQREHPRELDELDIVSGVALVPFRQFVGVVVPEDGVTTNLPEVQTVGSSARIRFVFRPPDGNVDDVAVFDVLPVFDRRVGRHPSPYVIQSIGINLWTLLHKMGGKPV